MNYKELFAIDFNNKKFMVFLDEFNKNTFLEINAKGEYDYPALEDYLALYKIFNISNPFISYIVPSFNFNKCVKVAKGSVLGLLSVITIINSIPNAMALDVSAKLTDENVIISEMSTSTKKQVIVIKDTDSLDEYLGEVKLTKDLILDTIESNKNLPEDIKKIVVEEFEAIYEVHPTANYRIFYENIKTLRVNIYSEEEYYKKFPAGSAASYYSVTNTMNIKEGASKYIISHEVAHSYHSLYHGTSNAILVKSEKHTALHEGMIDKMASYVTTEDGTNAYIISKNVLEFLMYLTDYTYEEYSRFGIDFLISKAKKQYKDVDFEYVSSSLNALMRAEIYHLNSEGLNNMYNELFEACLQKANKINGYEPFNRFIYVFNNSKQSELLNEYFQKYNTKLKDLGYNSETIKKLEQSLKTYEKANCVLYSETDQSLACFGYEDDNYDLYKINPDGSFSLVNANGSYTYQRFIPRNFDLFRMKVLTKDIINKGSLFSLVNADGSYTYFRLIPTEFGFFKMEALSEDKELNKSLVSILKEDTRISQHKYCPIPIYINGELLTTEMTGNLSIQVGFTKNGKAGFLIYNAEGKIIYKTNDDLRNLSNIDSLNSYLAFCYYLKELELNDVLNETYLKQYQSMSLGFYNFQVANDQILLEPFVLVTITGLVDGKDWRANYNLLDCKIYIYEDYIYAGNWDYDPEDYDYVIDLETILRFNGFLEDNKPYYTLKMTDLRMMAEYYLKSLSKSEPIR